MTAHAIISEVATHFPCSLTFPSTNASSVAITLSKRTSLPPASLPNRRFPAQTLGPVYAPSRQTFTLAPQYMHTNGADDAPESIAKGTLPIIGDGEPTVPEVLEERFRVQATRFCIVSRQNGTLYR